MSSPDKKTKKHEATVSNDNKRENMETLKKSIKELSYEESISELEIILTNVQDEKISLDKIKNNYIKGHLLLQHCEELLQFVEQEINEINLESLNID